MFKTLKVNNIKVIVALVTINKSLKFVKIILNQNILLGSDEEVPIMYPRQNAVLAVEDNPAIEDAVDVIEPPREPPIARNLIPVDQVIQEPEANIVEGEIYKIHSK